MIQQLFESLFVRILCDLNVDEENRKEKRSQVEKSFFEQFFFIDIPVLRACECQKLLYDCDKTTNCHKIRETFQLKLFIK